MDIQSDNAHVTSSSHQRGSRRARGIYRSVLAAHPGEPQGRSYNGTGSQPIVVALSARTHVLPMPQVPDASMIADPGAGGIDGIMPDNGMVERVIRTLKEKCIHRHRFDSIQHA